VRNTFPAPARLHGWLVKGNPSGRWKSTVDIAAFEAANNPDAGQPGTLVDSNPNALAALPGGRAVVDAGANDLLRVDESANISALAVFPVRFVPFGPVMIPMQPVPTSIAVGPDGALYVGQLTGFPFPMGGRTFSGSCPGATNCLRVRIHERARRRLRPPTGACTSPRSATSGCLAATRPEGFGVCRRAAGRRSC
jgi:hypothetical protein